MAFVFFNELFIIDSNNRRSNSKYNNSSSILRSQTSIWTLEQDLEREFSVCWNFLRSIENGSQNGEILTLIFIGII